MTSTRLCDCVYAKARKLYEKFNESKGEVAPDFDTIEEAEREVWAKTVAGKGNYIVEEKKRKPRAKKADSDEPKTSFIEPDWKEREKQQKRELALIERQAKQAEKERLKAEKAQKKCAL